MTATEPGTANHDAKLETLRAIARGFDTHDLDLIMSHFADDAVFEGPRGSDPCGTRLRPVALPRRPDRPQG